MRMTTEDLARGIAAGERPALARALSLAERDASAAAAVLARLADHAGHAHVVGITGPPGAGKSTLVGVMLRRLLQNGRRVAVLAVDPSSPVSGGALLGDRFRIGEAPGDERAFVRSTATRGSLGGLTRAARQMVQLMDAAGFDLVLVETVGTGQSEIDVARLADTLLVVFPPGLGDEMQAIKAGVLELADLLLVTKSDAPGAAQARQSLQAAAPMWRRAPPIHAVSAVTGEGIAALVDAVLARARDAPPAARREGADLRESFDRLRSELGRCLPFGPPPGLSVQNPPAGADADPSRLHVLVELGPGADAFRLGAVAGAFGALAAGAGLVCCVEERDMAAGRLQLLLERPTR